MRHGLPLAALMGQNVHLLLPENIQKFKVGQREKIILFSIKLVCEKITNSWPQKCFSFPPTNLALAKLFYNNYSFTNGFSTTLKDPFSYEYSFVLQ